jgi:dihydrofolate reductase
MRELKVNTFCTLDGVLQAPGGPEEDRSGGFEHGGWSANYWDDTMMQIMGAASAVPADLVLGRKTYEIFAAHWPFAGNDDPMAQVLNKATKYVATRTLTRLDWSNSRRIAGDVPAEIRKLKQQAGPELHVHGSGNLLQTLIQHGLVDEFRIWTFPLVVGKGKRLFAEGTTPSGLKLVDSKTSTTGVVIGTYRPAGAIPVGSFAFEKPSDLEVERRKKVAREG